jgi:hypothetical protein
VTSLVDIGPFTVDLKMLSVCLISTMMADIWILSLTVRFMHLGSRGREVIIHELIN